MSDQGERKSTSFYIEEEHLEWMKANAINRSELVNKLLTQYRTGKGGIGGAARELRKRQLESKIRNKENEVEQYREELERLEQQEEQAERGKRDDLDELLDEMLEKGFTMHKDAPAIDRIAGDWFNGSNPDAYEALQERNQNRDNAVPTERFE